MPKTLLMEAYIVDTDTQEKQLDFTREVDVELEGSNIVGIRGRILNALASVDIAEYETPSPTF